MTRKLLRRLIAALFVAAVFLPGCQPKSSPAISKLVEPEQGTGLEPKVWTRTILSKNYHLDRIYPSMKGPSSMEKVKLLDVETPELLWIVGYQAIVMDQEGDKQVSQEFMCHSNLDFEPKGYWESFKSDASMSGRLFTLSQGQQKVKFPQGYGIPVTSEMSLDLATQVLNLNIDNPNMEVRHKVTINFVRDKELTVPYKPLFQAAVQGFKTLETGKALYGVDKKAADQNEHGEGCSVGAPAIKGDVDEDKWGQKFTGHWVVHPGREENHTLVTNFLQLQFDTTIHYIAVHLHPFAVSLELIDRTEGKTVFKANVTPAAGKIGISEISHLESVEGVPIYKDHEYELVSVYNNTTDHDTDSMAVMYMYLLDTHFQKPTTADLLALKEKTEKEAAEAAKNGTQEKAKKSGGM